MEWQPLPSQFPVDHPQLSINIAATFAIDGFEAALTIWWSHIIGLPYEISWIPYGTTAEELRLKSSTINANFQGINLLFLRAVDLCSQHPEDRREVLTKNKSIASKPKQFSEFELATGFRQLTADLLLSVEFCRAPFLVFCMPLPPSEYGSLDMEMDWDESCDTKDNDARILTHDRLESDFIASLAHISNIHIFSSHALKRVLGSSSIAYSEKLDTLMHAPFTDRAYLALAPVVCRQVARLNKQSSKLIVLDCDNTLWGGAVGEVGAASVILSEPFVHLQNFFLQQQKNGMLLALCSRNIDQDVLDVFRMRQSDMPLELRHFVGRKVNWNPKSANIRELVEELSIALDSVIFVDDNPVEVSEVAAHCPGVQCVLVPREPALIPRFLAHSWVFDSRLKKGKGKTKEDSKRTELYRDTLNRNQMRANYNSHSAFLASLNLWIRIEELNAATVTRVAQLTDRTNQHNASKKSLTVADLCQMTGLSLGASPAASISDPGRPSHCVFSVTSGDRFCTHGLIGVMIFRNSWSEIRHDRDETCMLGEFCGTVAAAKEEFDSRPVIHRSLIVEQFLLSCRTLHLGIEHAMVRFLGEQCRAKASRDLLRGDTQTYQHHIGFFWKSAPRNEPSRAFFFSILNHVFVSSPEQASSTAETLPRNENKDIGDTTDLNVNAVVFPSLVHVVRPESVAPAEWEAMSKQQRKKLVKRIVIEAHKQRHSLQPGSWREYRKNKRLQIESRHGCKVNDNNYGDGNNDNNINNYSNDLPSDSKVSPLPTPSDSRLSSSKFTTTSVRTAGISTYKTKPLKIPQSGTIYISLSAAEQLHLVQLAPSSAMPQAAAEISQDEENRSERISRPVYISPEDAVGLHYETHTAIARGLADQELKSKSAPGHCPTSFLSEFMDKAKAAHSRGRHLGASEQIYQRMCELASVQSKTTETVDNSEVEHDFDDPEQEPMIETRDQYRERVHARKALRHDIRVALQQNNPDMHYKDVELYSEYNEDRVQFKM
jgi:FkbH-like protein